MKEQKIHSYRPCSKLHYTKELLLSVPNCYIINSTLMRFLKNLIFLQEVSFILTLKLVITSQFPQARLYPYT